MEKGIVVNHKVTSTRLAKAFALQAVELFVTVLLVELFIRSRYNTSIASLSLNVGVSDVFVFVVGFAFIWGIFAVFAAVRMYLKSKQTFTILPDKGEVIVSGKHMVAKKFESEKTNYFRVGVFGFWNAWKTIIKVKLGRGIPTIFLSESEFGQLEKQIAAYKKSL
ncbi:MAG: hypothetical protein JNK26_05320 [Candidatus Doudnabacteria bacterium]|nr:hypothetical protein [Candidatus Doudnabacteria bacterium]